MKNTNEHTPKLLTSSPETMKNKTRLSKMTAFYFGKRAYVCKPIPINKAIILDFFIRITSKNETDRNSPKSFRMIYHKIMMWWYRHGGGIIL
jgi:hypothetical protein